MTSSPARFVRLLPLWGLVLGGSAASAQVRPDTVLAGVGTTTVSALFRQPPRLMSGDSVEVNVPTPEVEALFRGSVQVDVATRRGGLQPSGYTLVVSDVANPSATIRRSVLPNDQIVVGLGGGDHSLSLEDLGDCRVLSMESGRTRGGMLGTATFDVECPVPPSVSVAVSAAPSTLADSVTIERPGEEPREIGVGTPAVFSDLRPGRNQLVVAVPAVAQRASTLQVGLAEEPGQSSVSVPIRAQSSDGNTYLIEPGNPALFTGLVGDSIALSLSVPRSLLPARSPRSVVVDLTGAKGGNTPDSVGVEIPGVGVRSVRVGEPTPFDSLPGGPVRIVVDLKGAEVGDSVKPEATDSVGWHIGWSLGAVSVAASDPTSFTTPTLGLSVVKDRGTYTDWLYINAQVGYWRSGPSAPDPVLPDDPRPPYRNRTIWTWSLGASLFPESFRGLGFSASWVEGRETASQEEKYMNRSRGVAFGPRFRVRPRSPWPAVILGLDAQYGEAEELRLDEPELRWSLTPVLSLSYVFR